jgi:hypothetical protein
MNVTDSPADETETTQDSNADSAAVDSKPWQFKRGNDPRRNTAGRPRKRDSLLEVTRKKVESAASKVADAKLKRLLRDDSVGNRAWAEYRDTYYGMPKQTLVLEQGESPMLALLERFNAIDQARTVEGEARVVDDNEGPVR